MKPKPVFPRVFIKQKLDLLDSLQDLSVPDPKKLAVCNAAAKIILDRAAFKRKCVSIFRSRVDKAIRNVVHSRSLSKWVSEVLGIDADGLIRHLESKFKPGMTWANHSMHGWHVDHIRPLASFDFNNPAHLKQAFHYTNLQPLWAEENLAKKDRWEVEL